MRYTNLSMKKFSFHGEDIVADRDNGEARKLKIFSSYPRSNASTHNYFICFSSSSLRRELCSSPTLSSRIFRISYIISLRGPFWSLFVRFSESIRISSPDCLSFDLDAETTPTGAQNFAVFSSNWTPKLLVLIIQLSNPNLSFALCARTRTGQHKPRNLMQKEEMVLVSLANDNCPSVHNKI
jgi:hypothetical protein